jgi:RNA polymerase sigma-70 factor, ECF subfamily
LAPSDSASVDVKDVKIEADRRLVRAVAGGSADALGQLYDRHAPIVFGLARRILMRVEDAEEVVQDVFAQVWRDAARYVPERATVAGWIVMLTRARAIDRLRARRARPDQAPNTDPGLVSPLPAPGRTPEEAAVSEDDGRQVRRALESLPPEQRMLVDLAYYEGLTQSEIAERTGVPLGTVKTRVRAAMATLRSALAS